MKLKSMTTLGALLMFAGASGAAYARGDVEHGSVPSDQTDTDTTQHGAVQQHPGTTGSPDSGTINPTGPMGTMNSPQGTSGSTKLGGTSTGTEAGEATIPKEPMMLPSRQFSEYEQQGQINNQEIEKVFGQETRVIELSSLDQEQVKNLQRNLQEKGYYKGNIDGIIGPLTHNALNKLLSAQHRVQQQLVQQGRLMSEMASLLGVSEMQPVRGDESPDREPSVGSDSDNTIGSEPGDVTQPQNFPRPQTAPHQGDERNQQGATEGM